MESIWHHRICEHANRLVELRVRAAAIRRRKTQDYEIYTSLKRRNRRRCQPRYPTYRSEASCRSLKSRGRPLTTYSKHCHVRDSVIRSDFYMPYLNAVTLDSPAKFASGIRVPLPTIGTSWPRPGVTQTSLAC